MCTNLCINKGKSYSLALSTLIFHVNIPKHYSIYTLFTASLSHTVFVVFNIPHNNKIQLKETEEETKNVGWQRSHRTFAFTQKDRELFGKAKPLQEHRPSRVTSCPTGFGYCTIWQSLYEVSILNGLALPKQLTVLLSKREVAMASSSTNVFCLLFHILVYFDNSIFFESWICEYKGYVIRKKLY